ncbi:MAG: hypothetical protein M3Y76_12860 [Chloroflexota bacterium]|nr:hypothetical protein [Chloroflexota bacterium]
MPITGTCKPVWPNKRRSMFLSLLNQAILYVIQTRDAAHVNAFEPACTTGVEYK